MKMEKKYILYSLIFTMFCGISIFAVKTTFRVTNAAQIIYPIPISTVINAKSFSADDLLYRTYKDSIYLTKNSAITINLSQIKDLSNNFQIAIINCETETIDILDRKNYSQKYNIEQNGYYQIFLREKEKKSYHSWVNITSKINLGIEEDYSINDKNEIYLIN